MEPTLFSFIWKYSRRQQLVLLAFTLVSFPFLYASLELPKRIINDAIGAESNQIPMFGLTLTQVQFLLVLCFAFLATVLISGLMKMRINTMKGVLSERLLRRLRYQLINRMMLFPAPYFRTTSQGELVSMITSEAEPMGGLMGDAVAQPAFQFGQMMTIMAFLFMQSFWFGLASVALIPLQAWLIPKLQRQINLLNKERIQEVRHLSSEIGESAAGISDLRANGGWRFRLAQFTDRLGRLFEIRFEIYQKKFFMKFLNNLISQLTPFFFYSIGGYLAIREQITVGALVAALAAYKDLSSPWKELLFFYNEAQDMSVRWQVVMERFAPRNILNSKLFDGEPATIPRLDGGIELKNVTVRDGDGNIVLEDITLSIPPGGRVAIQSSKPSERAAFAQLLTREVLPSMGSVTLSGHPMQELHQAVVTARVGYANSRPFFFDGTLGDNLMMPLMARPQEILWDPYGRDRKRIEAKRSGNSRDSLEARWLDPGLAGLADGVDIRDWWFQLNEAMGIDEEVFRRALGSKFDPLRHPQLAAQVVKLRPEIHARLIEKNLASAVYRFDPETFNPAVPLGSNLLFATPARMISQKMLAGDGQFMKMLHDKGLDYEGLNIAQAVMDTLGQTFGRDGTGHPLFQRLGIEEEIYQQLTDIAAKRARLGDGGLSKEERSLMLTVPFLLTAEQIGPSFPEKYKQEIVEIRRTQAQELRAFAKGNFVPVDPETYMPRLTMAENAIYGRVSQMAGIKAAAVENVVAEVLSAHGLRQAVAAIIFDLPTGLGGVKLPTVLQERVAFSRAAIKRPDILIMDTVLASHDAKKRAQARDKLGKLLPKATMIFMEDRFENPDRYDLFVEIRNGRIDGVTKQANGQLDENGTADFRRKVQIIAATPLFQALDSRNQRLLAFSAQWFASAPGQVIFAHGETADAAYLCLTGRAELRWPGTGPSDSPVTQVDPGRLIGDLSIIVNQPRPMDLVSVGPAKFLRIGAEELRAVIESDGQVAALLLQAVASNLVGAVENIQRSREVSGWEERPAALPVALDTMGRA